MSKTITLAALRLKQAADAINAAIGEADDEMVLGRLRVARYDLANAREQLTLTWQIEPVTDET